MRTLRIDSIGGASGDMLLAVLFDLGADVDRVRETLRSLPLEPFELRTEPCQDRGLRGLRARVETHAQPAPLDAHRHAPHRNLAEILRILEGGALPPSASALSRAVFERLGEAEARVHGTTVDRVHFHEVGATDSILDIAGCCLALERLHIDAVEVGPLPLGSGQTSTAHGVLPLPVPATAELLADHPVTATGEPHELVTPTGAALLMTWKAERQSIPASSYPAHITRTGFGFGSRRLQGRANAVRALILETAADDSRLADECTVLECNLDDTSPELLGALFEKLPGRGALDAFFVPVQMKKHRPGVLLTVLCRPGSADALKDVIFRESTTFGIREHIVRRTLLKRTHVAVATPYGPVRVKFGMWQGSPVTRAPEYEDCAACAGTHGIAVRAVYEAALQAAAALSHEPHPA